jgi:CO/xanthine dehydrogenase Mo-binding subunit/aerobic-type carbon monoxide dehydrogenase small subunit (CoxS/CutS family)
MDDIARRLGIDPLELRLKNLVEEGDRFVTGDELVSVGIGDCLKRAAEAVGWQSKQEQQGRELRGKMRGKGLAVMIKTTMTPSNSSALVRLNADGSAVLLTSSVELGQGTQTSLAQIVAEELGIVPERVSVTFPDTDVTPFDQSTSSSRTIFTMGSAARQAAGQIKQQLMEIGAHVLEANIEDLELREGNLQVKGAPEKRRTISQLFQAHYGAAVGSMAGSYDNQTRGGIDPKTGKGKASAFFFLSACAAEVEVDSETGKVKIERIVSAVDAGKAVNPRQCHMQNEGSMIMSLGSALFEEMVFDNGQPINATFLEYMPPSMEDHPRQFESVLVETPHPEGPYGAKGVGEAALGPVEPAIGNAIANALNGLRIKDLPIRPDRIIRQSNPQRKRAMKIELRTVINGREVEASVKPNQTLLEWLRDDLRLRGSREGCGVGVCGSCTVLVDGRPVSSCLMLATNADGKEIQTIEGLAKGDELDAVQQAFLDQQAFQCGYCTSGMIMAAKALLSSNPTPSEDEVRDYLSGNICRCGTYQEVMAAIRTLAEKNLANR